MTSSPTDRWRQQTLDRWQRFWFEPVPPHAFALLRILIGLLAWVSLLGVSDVSMFWALDGFVPADGLGTSLKSFFLTRGLGDISGRVLYFASMASYVAMTVGYRTGLAVTLSLAASLVQISWNYLPLSGANSTIQVLLFCLIWADCGAVWSLDAWLARRRGQHQPGDAAVPTYAIAPLRLMRFQIALIYLNSGLWKLYSPVWRDGSTVHYVLDLNVFQRFPESLPAGLDWITTLATYSVLLWEIGFAFMLLYAPTRRLALIAGVLIHLGMFSTLAIGPFHLVMLAGYVAFLNPFIVPTLPHRFLRWVLRRPGAVATHGPEPVAPVVQQAGQS